MQENDSGDVDRDRNERRYHRHDGAAVRKEHLHEHLVHSHEEHPDRIAAKCFCCQRGICGSELAVLIYQCAERLREHGDAYSYRRDDEHEDLDRQRCHAPRLLALSGGISAGHIRKEQIRRHERKYPDDDDVQLVRVRHRGDRASLVECGGVARVDSRAERLGPRSDEYRYRREESVLDLGHFKIERKGVTVAELMELRYLHERLRRPAEEHRDREPDDTEKAVERIQIQYHYRVRHERDQRRDPEFS